MRRDYAPALLVIRTGGAGLFYRVKSPTGQDVHTLFWNFVFGIYPVFRARRSSVIGQAAGGIQ